MPPSAAANVPSCDPPSEQLCVLDSGKEMKQPWRSFNRNAIRAGPDLYKPDDVVNACGADNPEFDTVAEPKAPGLPEGVQAKLDSLWHADLESPERDEHAGAWAPSGVVGKEGAFFYKDGESVEEFAIAVVGLENALADYIDKEREVTTRRGGSNPRWCSRVAG